MAEVIQLHPNIKEYLEYLSYVGLTIDLGLHE